MFVGLPDEPLRRVNTHVSHIYGKLQVKSVASAVSLAVREGLV